MKIVEFHGRLMLQAFGADAWTLAKVLDEDMSPEEARTAGVLLVVTPARLKKILQAVGVQTFDGAPFISGITNVEIERVQF